MNYTLHQLRILVKVADLKSITKAADGLHLTQPAVSIQLKKLQDQFSIPLTEVVGRQLYVTDFGQEIVKAAERILEEVDAIAYTTMQYKDQLAGRLRISVASTGKYVMPYFLSDFMRAHPGVDLRMDVTNKSRVVQSLADNEVDLSLVSVLPQKLDLDAIDLVQNKLYLVGSAEMEDMREGGPESIFSDHPLIFREEGSATRQAMEQFLDQRGFSAVKKFELTSNEAVKQAVLAGMGYSVMPLIGIRSELDRDQLRIIPIEGLPIITYWHIVWLRAKRLSPVAKAYLAFVRAEEQAIIRRHFSWYEAY